VLLLFIFNNRLEAKKPKKEAEAHNGHKNVVIKKEIVQEVHHPHSEHLHHAGTAEHAGGHHQPHQQEHVMVKETVTVFKQKKQPKTLLHTEYDKCKASCKQVRDTHNTQQYVEQLKEELRLAEEQLAMEHQQQQAAAVQQVHPPVHLEPIVLHPAGHHNTVPEPVPHH